MNKSNIALKTCIGLFISCFVLSCSQNDVTDSGYPRTITLDNIELKENMLFVLDSNRIMNKIAVTQTYQSIKDSLISDIKSASYFSIYYSEFDHIEIVLLDNQNVNFVYKNLDSILLDTVFYYELLDDKLIIPSLDTSSGINYDIANDRFVTYYLFDKLYPGNNVPMDSLPNYWTGGGTFDTDSLIVNPDYSDSVPYPYNKGYKGDTLYTFLLHFYYK